LLGLGDEPAVVLAAAAVTFAGWAVGAEVVVAGGFEAVVVDEDGGKVADGGGDARAGAARA